jgi:hypothetical protein
MLLHCDSLEPPMSQLGPKCENLTASISSPLYPLIADIEQTFRHFAFVPLVQCHKNEDRNPSLDQFVC